MKQEIMTVVRQKELAKNIFELVLHGDLVTEMNQPGQFLHIKVPREDLLLRRPLSLAKIDQEKQECTVIYRVEGAGTDYFSQLPNSAELDVLGPLGHGFPIDFIQPEDVAFVIGGGIGVPPMYQLSRELTAKGAKVIHLLGFANKDVVFYEDEFKALGQTLISTDDGSYGVHGHVGNLLEEALKTNQAAAVYACGSNGLLKTVNREFLTHPHAYLSLEARMACGMGACYACVVHVEDDETGLQSKKVCSDGPVFETGEVVL